MSITNERRRDLIREHIVADINRLRADLQELEQALQDYDRLRTVSKAETVEKNGAERPPTLREAVLVVMRSGRPGQRWHLIEIRSALMGRGWLKAGERGRKDLQNMMALMLKKSQVLKPKTGVYTLPRATPLFPS